MNGQSLLAASRRQFLTAAVAISAGAAGCTEESEDLEFEATGFGLPEEARDQLVLGQTFTDAPTATRKVGDIEATPGEGDDEVTITNKVVGYERDLERFDLGRKYAPTLLESFVRTQNPDGYRGAGVVAVNGTGPFAISVVVPSGAASGDGSIPNTLSMVPPEGVREDATVPEGGAYVMSLGDFFTRPPWPPIKVTDQDPGRYDTDEEIRFLRSMWFVRETPAGKETNPSPVSVAVALGDSSTEELFGRSPEEMPGEKLEEGEAFGSTNPFLVFNPVGTGPFEPVKGEFTGDDLVADTFDEIADWPTPDNFGNAEDWPTEDNFLGAPSPAALGGSNFKVGVLSSPNAELGGQPVSPLADMELEEVLTRDEATDLISSAVGDGTSDEPHWISGPTRLPPTAITESDHYMPEDRQPIMPQDRQPIMPEDRQPIMPQDRQPIIRDEETEFATFVGVVDDDYPWLTFAHVARAAVEDVVVMVGAHATPLAPGSQFVEDGVSRFNDVMTTVDPITYHFSIWNGARCGMLVGEDLQAMAGLFE